MAELCICSSLRLQSSGSQRGTGRTGLRLPVCADCCPPSSFFLSCTGFFAAILGENSGLRTDSCRAAG